MHLRALLSVLSSNRIFNVTKTSNYGTAKSGPGTDKKELVLMLNLNLDYMWPSIETWALP